MPITTIDETTGIGIDISIPSPHGVPKIPEGFHYETTGSLAGYLVWLRDGSVIMAGGGFYEVWRATSYDGTYTKAADISNPSSGKYVSYFDTTAPSTTFWKLRSKSPAGRYSPFTKPIKLLTETDLCEVILGITDFSWTTFQEGTLTAYPVTTAEYILYRNDLIPVPKVSDKLDVDGMVFVLKLIPSADIGNIKYKFDLITPDGKIVLGGTTGISIPSQDQVYLTTLL